MITKIKNYETSKTHQRFADYLNNQRVLEHPEEFLDKNWKDVLNFWIFLDTLTEEQMKIINDAYSSVSRDELQFAAVTASDAADVVCAAADACVFAGDAAYVAAGGAAAAFPTYELIGSHILQEQGKSLIFLPLYLKL